MWITVALPCEFWVCALLTTPKITCYHVFTRFPNILGSHFPEFSQLTVSQRRREMGETWAYTFTPTISLIWVNLKFGYVGC